VRGPVAERRTEAVEALLEDDAQERRIAVGAGVGGMSVAGTDLAHAQAVLDIDVRLRRLARSLLPATEPHRPVGFTGCDKRSGVVLRRPPGFHPE
jgi:hypothetical protein